MCKLLYCGTCLLNNDIKCFIIPLFVSLIQVKYDIGYDDLNSYFDFNINNINIYLQEITKCKI